jgi:molybdopterin-guanine dinucleotide biosynthesis protein A
MRPQRITGLVLAGGRGSRLGGVDKGLVEWRGRPLVAHAIERLAPQVDRVLISANRNREPYEAFGHPVIADSLADYAGPLAGLQAGLAACTTPLLATVPCDAPGLPFDLVARLLAALEADNASVAVAQTQGKFQPTFLLCRRELSAALDAWLAGDNRKVADWLRQMGAIAVPFADEAAFANFNTPEDLA